MVAVAIFIAQLVLAQMVVQEVQGVEQPRVAQLQEALDLPVAREELSQMDVLLIQQ
jgi:predicted XRE-type DNA-binding protein